MVIVGALITTVGVELASLSSTGGVELALSSAGVEDASGSTTSEKFSGALTSTCGEGSCGAGVSHVPALNAFAGESVSSLNSAPVEPMLMSEKKNAPTTQTLPHAPKRSLIDDDTPTYGRLLID